MGVKAAEVAALPRITHILEQSFWHSKKDPLTWLDDVVTYLRASQEPQARKFMETWDSFTPTVHRQLPFEAFCLAAGVPTKRILALLVTSCYEDSQAASQLIAAVNHPKVVMATVAAAMEPDGHADRKMLHMHKGFLPLPKNQTTIFSGGSQQHNTQNNVQNNNGVPLPEDRQTFNPNAVASIETRMNKIADRFNSRMGQLPERAEAHTEADPVEPTEPTSLPDADPPPLVDAEWA